MKTLGNLARSAVAVAAALVFVTAAHAADLAKLTGTIVLTIGGAVKNANLSAPNHFDASTLKVLECDYSRAAAFDVPMLEALGMVKTTFHTEP